MNTEGKQEQTEMRKAKNRKNTEHTLPTPRILAPAGSFDCLSAAISAGSHAIYFGCGVLNMRARAGSFKFTDMEAVVAQAHVASVAAYLTLNTVMYDADIESIHMLCKEAKRVGVDAVICADIAAIQIARSHGLRVHISTQQNISNIEAVRFFATFADTVVLARELTLEQISYIHKQIVAEHICGPSGELVQLEAFIHGALCVAISGKCGMSLAAYNSSANRGACFQVCRRSYKVSDVETGNEMVIDGEYVMSPKDLCTLGMLDKLIDAGVVLLKIEGRARGPEYVATVVSAYVKAVTAYVQGGLTPTLKEELITHVSTVFNRGFWQNGYYMGVSAGEWCSVAGSAATTVKSLVGVVENYYPKAGTALIRLENSSLSQNCVLAFSGPTTGWLQIDNAQLRDDDNIPSQVLQGSVVTVKVPSTVRKSDKVFEIKTRTNFER